MESKNRDRIEVQSNLQYLCNIIQLYNSVVQCSSSLLTFPLVVPNLCPIPQSWPIFAWNFSKTRTDMQLHSASPNKLWPNKSPPASVPLLALRPPNPAKHNQLATRQRCLYLENISGMFHIYPDGYGWFAVRSRQILVGCLKHPKTKNPRTACATFLKHHMKAT